MSAFKEIPSRKKAIKKAKKQLTRNSPCGRPPVQVAGVTGSFDRAEAGRHNRIRAKVHWDEVTLDTSGFKIRVKHYIAQLQYTPNGSDWFTARRATVGAKTADEGTDDHVLFKNIQKNLGYRVRVRAVANDGCKGDFSDWFVIGNPGADEPPAPTNVKIQDNDAHMRVTMRWDAAAAPDDDDLFDDKINHFVVEISKVVNFSTTYRKNRGKKGNHISFRIDDADENETFFGRVRSVSADKDKSAWIPATIAGNSDPGATAQGVSVGRAMNKTKAPKAPTGLSLTFFSDTGDGPRSDRWKAKILWNEVGEDVLNNDVDVQTYAVQFQSSANGTTWTNDIRKFSVHAKDDDADTTQFKIVHNINGKKFYRARVRAISETGTRGAWTSWSSDSNAPGTLSVPTPTGVTVKQKTKPKDRVIVDWDAPIDPDDSDLPDERVHFFQVAIKKNSTTPTTLASAFKFDRKVMATDKSFRVANADEDSTWFAWVRTIDDSGNKSVWIPATTAGNSSSGATPSGVETDDGVRVGRVVKHAGNTIPQGYLRANGQSVATATWPDLFAEIGYTYGGSGANFNVPDHRRRQARGVGASQVLGDTEGLSEGSRDEDHGKHNQGSHGKHRHHKHKHHHKRKRKKLSSSAPSDGAHADTSGGTPHNHQIPTQNTSNNPSVVPRGTTASNAAGPSHDHTYGGGGQATNAGGFHTHALDEKHEDDLDVKVVPDGASSLFTDSLTGGTISASSESIVDQGASYDGGPTDASGNALLLADDDDGVKGHGHHALPDDDDGVRGHKKHPHIRFHYNVKAG